jgi:hypothetical protein
VIYEEDYNDTLSKQLFEESGVELVRITPQPELEPRAPIDLPEFKGRN